jgi:C1A family cysteine protease
MFFNDFASIFANMPICCPKLAIIILLFGWLMTVLTLFGKYTKKAIGGCIAALFLASAPILFAQESAPQEPRLQRAPLNPAFVKWQDAKRERDAQIALDSLRMPVEPADRRFGYIPDPFLPPAPNAPLTQLEAMVKANLATFQPILDPRTWLPSGLPPGLPSPRNQGQYGTCWAFSSIAALEYALTKVGTPTTLSEWHLAYFAYNPINGIPGFTKDSVSLGDHETFDQGGNFTRAMAIMVRGNLAGGPVPANSSQYGGALPSASTNSVATIKRTYLASTASVNAIKGLVNEHRVVVASMMWPETNESSKYNGSTHSFRYVQGGQPSTNHGITIVGYDDTWAKTKFPEDNQPTTDGAWIVRNSWGPSFGDGGYFYMSYDTSISSIGIYEGFAGADAKTYQYDMHGRVGNVGYNNNTAWFSNIFTATANHSIKAVGFYTSGQGALYEISIRKGVDSTPTGGTLALASQTGSLGAAGYHRVDLNSQVSVGTGEKFAVIVKLTDSGSDGLPIACSYAYPGFTSDATATPEVGWISSNGYSWHDITVGATWETFSICLKAFADVGTFVPVASVGLNKTSMTLSVGASETLAATIQPTDATNKSVLWSSSNTSAATVSSSGLVRAVAAGTATITATSAADSSKFALCVVTVNPVIAVSVSPKTASLQTGETQTFIATVTGTSNIAVTWAATGGTITQGGAYTAPSAAGTYTVTATSNADSSKSDSAIVTVTVPQVYIVFHKQPKALFVGDAATLQASVVGLANNGVEWSASHGSFSAATSTSATYRAPNTVPPDERAVITATSIERPSESKPVRLLIRSLDWTKFDNNTKASPQLLDLANAFLSKEKADLDKYDLNGDGIVNEEDFDMLFIAMGW